MKLELFFVIRHDGKFERIYRVETPTTTIGRIQSNVLCLSDFAVSRNHAILNQTPKGFVIRDLNSRNGTQVNGQRITETVLPAAAIVAIGPFQLTAFSSQASAQAELADTEGSTREHPAHLVRRDDRVQREQRLTPAQRHVYEAFLKGRTEKEVARQLQVSINTVHSHSHAIYTVFGVSSRAELLSLCAGHLSRDDLQSFGLQG